MDTFKGSARQAGLGKGACIWHICHARILICGKPGQCFWKKV